MIEVWFETSTSLLNRCRNPGLRNWLDVCSLSNWSSGWKKPSRWLYRERNRPREELSSVRSGPSLLALFGVRSHLRSYSCTGRKQSPDVWVYLGNVKSKGKLSAVSQATARQEAAPFKLGCLPLCFNLLKHDGSPIRFGNYLSLQFIHWAISIALKAACMQQLAT